MEEVLKTIGTVLGIVAGAGAALGLIIGGVFYVLGLVKKGKNNEDDRLISVLEKTVSALEEKVDIQKRESDQVVIDLTKKIDDLTTKVDHLEKENATLTKVLQGRDEQTQIFYKKAFEAMEQAGKTHILVESMSKTQTELMRVLTALLKPSVTINNQPTQPAP